VRNPRIVIDPEVLRLAVSPRNMRLQLIGALEPVHDSLRSGLNTAVFQYTVEGYVEHIWFLAVSEDINVL
jgi:hypothetical protein